MRREIGEVNGQRKMVVERNLVSDAIEGEVRWNWPLTDASITDACRVALMDPLSVLPNIACEPIRLSWRERLDGRHALRSQERNPN